jgi:hypothetical protein
MVAGVRGGRDDRGEGREEDVGAGDLERRSMVQVGLAEVDGVGDRENQGRGDRGLRPCMGERLSMVPSEVHAWTQGGARQGGVERS